MKTCINCGVIRIQLVIAVTGLKRAEISTENGSQPPMQFTLDGLRAIGVMIDEVIDDWCALDEEVRK